METARIYYETYGTKYSSSGCSYRGLPPHYSTVQETKTPRTVGARMYEVLLEHMEVRINKQNVMWVGVESKNEDVVQ